MSEAVRVDPEASIYDRLAERWPAIDFDEFHQRTVPARLEAGNAAVAAAALAGKAPLAFRLEDGRAYSYIPEGGAVRIVGGEAEADTVVELSEALFSDFANQLRSGPGLFYGGKIQVPEGFANTLFDWEPAIRAMYHGRPVYDAATVDLRDAGGQPLDLGRVFTGADDDDEMRHFLGEAGYLRVSGVFTGDEVARINELTDGFAETARPGDRNSWWGRDGEGRQQLCRLTYLGSRSQELARITDDARIGRLVRLFGKGDQRTAHDRLDGAAVILKVPGIVEGLADLPWHVDCGLGGHPVMCTTLQISLLLGAANADTGNLRAMAGSHRGSCNVAAWDADVEGPAVVDLNGQPGDCLLHLSDTLHTAPPPRGEGPFRRSFVSSYHRPELLEIIGPGQAFNDIIAGREDGMVGAL